MSLRESQYSVAESDSSLSVSITLSNRASQNVIVEVTLSGQLADGNVEQ